MKVLIIVAGLNERSGWGRYSRSIVDGLIAQGVDIRVCADDNHAAPYEIYRLKHGRSVSALVMNCLAARRAARDTDIVHALDGWPYGVYGLFAVLGTKKRLFINGVGTYSVAPLYSLLSGWLLRIAYARAEQIFCISNYTARQLIKAGISAKNIRTVLQGSTKLADISAAEHSEYIKMFAIEDKQPIVLTVGAVKDRKGQLDTLKAVGILKKNHPQILYVVIGTADSDYAQELNRYADEHGLTRNLLMLSNADDKILSFFYSVAAIFALNSNTDEMHHHFEGFGLVIVEAYQFSTPAVGSRDCGIEDAMNDGVTGYLTNQRDQEDIAERIEAVLSRREFFSENAKKAYTTFNWEKTTSEYREGYLRN